jgi:hypothetical protein
MSINPIAKQGTLNLFDLEGTESKPLSLEKDFSFSDLLKADSNPKGSLSTESKDHKFLKGEKFKHQEASPKKVKNQDYAKLKLASKEETPYKSSASSQPKISSEEISASELNPDNNPFVKQADLKVPESLIINVEPEEATELDLLPLPPEVQNFEGPYFIKPEMLGTPKDAPLELESQSFPEISAPDLEKFPEELNAEYENELFRLAPQNQGLKHSISAMNPWHLDPNISLMAIKVAQPVESMGLLKSPVPLDLQFMIEDGNTSDALLSGSARKTSLPTESWAFGAAPLGSKVQDNLTSEKLDVQGFDTALHGHAESVKTAETVAQIQVVQQILEDFRAQISKKTPQFRIPLTHEMYGDLEVRLTFNEGENVEAQFYVTSDVLKNLIVQNQGQIRGIFQEANLSCPPENLKILKTKEFNT